MNADKIAYLRSKREMDASALAAAKLRLYNIAEIGTYAYSLNIQDAYDRTTKLIAGLEATLVDTDKQLKELETNDEILSAFGQEWHDRLRREWPAISKDTRLCFAPYREVHYEEIAPASIYEPISAVVRTAPKRHTAELRWYRYMEAERAIAYAPEVDTLFVYQPRT